MVKEGFSHENPVGDSVEWYTPKWIFDGLDLEFDLDPCSPKEGGFVPAKKKFWLPDYDGLSEDWFGNVWVNPPYGKETGLWLSKLAAHGEGIALVFARTSTKWFQKIVSGTSGVLFVNRRVRFISGATGEAGGTPGADSMLISFGEENANALLTSGLGNFFKYQSK
jgi:hypothetical protein